MEQILSFILDQIVSQFDYTYCVTVNILTYIIINTIPFKISSWNKRLILLASIFSLGIIYYIEGIAGKILINSAILAPVSWTWLFKPICKKLGIDYSNIKNF